jgi:flagellar biosynthesis anti-sigma factor FlgM
MDIRDIQSRSTGPTDESRSARGVGASAASRAAADRTPDSVTLSNRAQAFQETRRAALAAPDVRTDRVEDVRGRLASGGLVPDPERIARALLEQGVL